MKKNVFPCFFSYNLVNGSSSQKAHTYARRNLNHSDLAGWRWSLKIAIGGNVLEVYLLDDDILPQHYGARCSKTPFQLEAELTSQSGLENRTCVWLAGGRVTWVRRTLQNVGRFFLLVQAFHRLRKLAFASNYFFRSYTLNKVSWLFLKAKQFLIERVELNMRSWAVTASNKKAFSFFFFVPRRFGHKRDRVRFLEPGRCHSIILFIA